MHAYHAHRLLGNGKDEKYSEAKDRGNILEELIYGVNSGRLVALNHDNYKTKDAQQDRDLLREAGKIPVLKKDAEEYNALGLELLSQINSQGIHFSGGKYQYHAEWTGESLIGPVDCHGYLDYWNSPIIYDLKTTTDVSPKKVQRLFVDMGWDIAHAAYIEGMETMNPDLAGRIKMLFIVCEIDKPFCIQLYEPDGMMISLGKNKWDTAKFIWKQCMDSGEWPGYFSGIGRISPTPWQMTFSQDIDTKQSMED